MISCGVRASREEEIQHLRNNDKKCMAVKYD
jgi:hypothetical protein